MCGRYGLNETEKVYPRFDIAKHFPELSPQLEIFPGTAQPVIVKHSPNQLVMMEWGVKPAWSTRSIINGRDDKVGVSRFFVTALRTNRCIVPASLFYEWDKVGGTGAKLAFTLKDHELFGMAGLILTVKDKQGKEQQGYVIITTSPNQLLERYHPRMPVILNPDDEEDWLNPDETEVDRLLNFLIPYPENKMEAEEVKNTHKR